MTTKECSVCKKEKDRDAFYKHSRHKSGLTPACKECANQRKRKYYAENKERLLERQKEYAKKNKKKISAAGKKFWINNKQRLSKKKKAHYADNRKAILRATRIYSNGYALYKTCVSKLTIDEHPVADKDGLLLVNCTYCGKKYYPTISQIANRIKALNGNTAGEHRLYCSTNCKKSCPVYRKIKWPDDFKVATSREVQPDLRQMVFVRDNYSCQICGGNAESSEIHCHHIEGLNQNPIESADIDVCITLCKSCHKRVHQQKGCRYFDLKCKEAA